MSIPLVNTWGVGDKFTSSQANALATYLTYALDKRSGQTDTIASTLTLTGVVTCTGEGRLIPNYEVGADANTTYTLSNGISVIDATSGLTADRTYTLSNTGAVAGDYVRVYAGTTRNVIVNNNGGTALCVVGGTGVAHATWAGFRHNGTNWVLVESPSLFYPARRMNFTPDAYCSTARDSTAWSTTIVSDTFDLMTSTEVGFTPGRTLLKTVNTGSTASYAYRMRLTPMVLPQGQKLTSVVATVKGAAGHGGLPQQMPGLLVSGYTEPFGTSASTLLSTGWALDASGTTAAYEASHTITFTPDENNVIDHSTYTYELFFLGEGGSNALANLTIDKVVFNFAFI